MRIILARLGSDRTVSYAVDELARCLKQMDGSACIDKRVYTAADPQLAGILWVGLDGSVAESVDDEIRIDVKDGAGIITASSPRAVLIAVYRFLYELGCRWLRPGDDGEKIPALTLTPAVLNVHVAEKASYRHRAVCIEGGVSYEHVYNMINWIPKVGMNGYYVQFHIPSCFFNRWYKHENNPLRGAEAIDDEAVKHMWLALEDEIIKRGLLYHATGHGWTCEPFGVHGTSWAKDESVIAPEISQYFAEVNGKRELWGNVALNTNLCYSNPTVREKMTDAITRYCIDHPAVDYLHFWLADSSNNHCECENCRNTRPADFYVQMLNELDRKMTAAGVPTKVVFLIYVDLLWEPEVNRIENPDRFVLMFAPITRTYYKEFADFDRSEKVELAPYVRNKNKMPRSVAENITRLSRWQEQFPGDSFDFDYHLMWHHHTDIGYYQVSRLLHNDMANLSDIGLNGMVSCQLQRASFPTGLPMYSMAKALWNKNSRFEDVSEDYFRSAFGEDAKTVENYLRTLSDLLVQDNTDDFKARAAEAKQVIDRFAEEHIAGKASLSADWNYLRLHAEINSAALAIMCDPDDMPTEIHNAKVSEFQRFLFAQESELHNVFDTAQAFGRYYKKMYR